MRTPANAPVVHHVDGITPDLADQMLRCWVDVSNAGGAVGFVPPVTADDVRPAMEAFTAAVDRGDELLVVVEIEATLAAFAAIRLAKHPLQAHYGHVVRVQVRPDLHGLGLGRVLMDGIHDRARAVGLEGLTLSVRGGTGTDDFYVRCGYAEVGRIPGAVRLPGGDDRDSIEMFRRL